MIKFEYLQLKFVDPIPEDLHCCICLSFLKLAQKSQCCGNTFCLTCIDTWLQKNNTCPLCRAENPMTVFDNEKIKLCDDIRVECPLSCGWVGYSDSLFYHGRVCKELENHSKMSVYSGKLTTSMDVLIKREELRVQLLEKYREWVAEVRLISSGRFEPDETYQNYQSWKNYNMQSTVSYRGFKIDPPLKFQDYFDDHCDRISRILGRTISIPRQISNKSLETLVYYETYILEERERMESDLRVMKMKLFMDLIDEYQKGRYCVGWTDVAWALHWSKIEEEERARRILISKIRTSVRERFAYQRFDDLEVDE